MEKVFEYFFKNDGWFLIGAIVLAITLFTVRNCDRELTWSESLIANWYLWNVVVIHVMLDGLCGAHGFGGIMNNNYRILDKRYRPHLVGKILGPTSGDRALVYTLNEMELFGHSLMCLFAFYGVCYKTRWRHGAECIALVTQAVGGKIRQLLITTQYFLFLLFFFFSSFLTIFFFHFFLFSFSAAVCFVMPDLLTGCENMQPINVKTCLPPFEPFYFFFYYFGVVINWLWVVVPMIALYFVVKSDVEEKEMLSKEKKA